MGATKIGDLKVVIGGDDTNLKKAIAGARRNLKRLAITAAAALGAAAVGLGLMTKRGLEFIDSQAKMARTIDGSVDALRALQLAGEDAGVSSEIVGQSMQMLGKRLAEAERDGIGPAKEALDDLGLSAGELMKLDADKRLAMIADRAKKLGFSAQQSGDLLRQFGVRNSEMALLVMQGGDAIRSARGEVEEFGLSMDAETTAKVERANDAISRLGLIFEGMRVQLAAKIAPILERMAVKFQEITKAGGPLQNAIERLTTKIAAMLEAFISPEFVRAAEIMISALTKIGTIGARALGLLADNARIAGVAMTGLGLAMAFMGGPIGLAVVALAAGIGLLASKLGDAKSAADLLETSERGLETAFKDLDVSSNKAADAGLKVAKSHLDQAEAAVLAAEAEYEMRDALISRMTAEAANARARAKEQPNNLFLRGRAESIERDIAAFGKPVNDARANLEGLRRTIQAFTFGKIAVETNAAGNAIAETGKKVVESTDQFEASFAAFERGLDPAKARQEEYRKAAFMLIEAEERGIISAARRLELWGKMNEKFKEAPAAVRGTAKSIDDLDTSLQSLLSRLDPTIAKTKDYQQALAVLKRSLDAGKISQTEFDYWVAQLGDSFQDNKQRLAGWEQGLNSAFGNLIDNARNGREAVTALLGDLLNLAVQMGISRALGGDGWRTSSLFKIGKNAQGTDNWRGGMTWVGELGPEIVNLPRGAKVTPNNKIGNMGGVSVNYSPTYNMPGATLEAVEEVKSMVAADRAKFDTKVILAIGNGVESRVLG